MTTSTGRVTSRPLVREVDEEVLDDRGVLGGTV
jgi:hypothetical protein